MKGFVVKRLYEFFKQNPSKHVTLLDFLNTVPGFLYKAESGVDMMNMGIANETSAICKKMAEDRLLIPVTVKNQSLCILDSYISSGNLNFDDYNLLLSNLDYGTYDFKYLGFVFTRDYFERSVVPIVGRHENGDEDIGSAYYIGDRMFVTASHCVKGLERFKLLSYDLDTIKLKEVWYHNDDDCDLAIIVADEDIDVPALKFDEVNVLDSVIVMGYPPVPGVDIFEAAETATVGACITPLQKNTAGEVVGTPKKYLSSLDHFLINARVKGGNSGGPVINQHGKVIGTVVEIPLDSTSGSDGCRYDTLGYGLCLPSKYVEELIDKPVINPLASEGYYYKSSN